MKYFNLFVFAFLLIGTAEVQAKDLSSSEVLKPEVVEAMEMMADKYECTYETSFEVSVGWGIGGSMEVTCTGTGTSTNSGEEACERAGEVMQACVTFWNNF